MIEEKESGGRMIEEMESGGRMIEEKEIGGRMIEEKECGGWRRDGDVVRDGAGSGRGADGRETDTSRVVAANIEQGEQSSDRMSDERDGDAQGW